MSPVSDGVRTPKFWQALVGECVGTIFLVLVGCGSFITPKVMSSGNGTESIVTTSGSTPDPVRVAFAFGVTYAVLIYVLRYITGGHFNPVVSLAAAITRKVSLLRAILYCVVQVIGGILGAAILFACSPPSHRSNLGATVPQAGVGQDQAFAVEFFGAMVFLFVVTACRDLCKGEDNPPYTHPFVMGLTLIAVELFAVPISGGSFNPARSFGPAVVSNEWNNHWIYWFGPILGGLAGALIYDFIFSSSASLSRVKNCLLANDGPVRKAKNRGGTDTGGGTLPEEQALRRTPSPVGDHEEIELKIDDNSVIGDKKTPPARV